MVFVDRINHSSFFVKKTAVHIHNSLGLNNFIFSIDNLPIAHLQVSMVKLLVATTIQFSQIFYYMQENTVFIVIVQ